MIDTSQSIIIEKESHIEQLETKLHETEEQLGSTETKLHETEERLGTTETKLHETEEQLGSTETKLHETEERLGTIETKLHETEERLGSTETKLHETEEKLERTVQELSLSLKDTTLVVQAREARLQETESKVQEQSSIIAEKESHIEQLETKLHSTKAKLEEQSEEIAQLERERKLKELELQGALERAQTQVQVSSEELAAIRKALEAAQADVNKWQEMYESEASKAKAATKRAQDADELALVLEQQRAADKEQLAAVLQSMRSMRSLMASDGDDPTEHSDGEASSDDDVGRAWQRVMAEGKRLEQRVSEAQSNLARITFESGANAERARRAEEERDTALAKATQRKTRIGELEQSKAALDAQLEVMTEELQVLKAENARRIDELERQLQQVTESSERWRVSFEASNETGDTAQQRNQQLLVQVNEKQDRIVELEAQLQAAQESADALQQQVAQLEEASANADKAAADRAKALAAQIEALEASHTVAAERQAAQLQRSQQLLATCERELEALRRRYELQQLMTRAIYCAELTQEGLDASTSDLASAIASARSEHDNKNQLYDVLEEYTAASSVCVTRAAGSSRQLAFWFGNLTTLLGAIEQCKASEFSLELPPLPNTDDTTTAPAAASEASEQRQQEELVEWIGNTRSLAFKAFSYVYENFVQVLSLCCP